METVQTWTQHHKIDDLDAWRAANGITTLEFQTHLKVRSHLETRLNQARQSPPFQTFATAFHRLTGGEEPAEGPLADHADLTTFVLGRWALDTGLIQTADLDAHRSTPQWRQAMGQSPPDPRVEIILSAFSQLIATNPTRMGYPSWSLPLAVLQHWQWTGKAAARVAAL